jgi:hypothetical protein
VTEKEYIKVNNRILIGLALSVLNGVLPDVENIQPTELDQMVRTLSRWQIYLLDEIQTEDVED